MLPTVFETKNGEDPVAWINRYKLLVKLNKWSESEAIDLIQLFLGKKEELWYESIKEKIQTLTELEEKFKDKYATKEFEYLTWNKLQTIKQSNYEEFEDFVVELESLLRKFGVKEDKVKLQILIQALDSKSRNKVL
ncbi:hypothetical protein BB561_003905 [Smittium simulii]|uniref:GP-PDE domain-containing protein n=1 Tax=Smittium simulii TaxID=133385 RepID=A0A2T9YJ17_9FUNG|nr:hypothetical protein BB561_003905 [Smittium simulii]